VEIRWKKDTLMVLDQVFGKEGKSNCFFQRWSSLLGGHGSLALLLKLTCAETVK